MNKPYVDSIIHYIEPALNIAFKNDENYTELSFTYIKLSSHYKCLL